MGLKSFGRQRQRVCFLTVRFSRSLGGTPFPGDDVTVFTIFPVRKCRTGEFPAAHENAVTVFLRVDFAVCPRQGQGPRAGWEAPSGLAEPDRLLPMTSTWLSRPPLGTVTLLTSNTAPGRPGRPPGGGRASVPPTPAPPVVTPRKQVRLSGSNQRLCTRTHAECPRFPRRRLPPRAPAPGSQASASIVTSDRFRSLKWIRWSSGHAEGCGGKELVNSRKKQTAQ